ncbi:PIN domain-containing protein [Candidatus Pacearchaeota archaeon]|nr:PIN domain-containing protein [Candidatus Pacearchaeota archaeon]
MMTKTDEAYVFDTYAILEIIKGSKNYEPYLDCNIIINDFIFAELCYKLFRESPEKANYYIGKYSLFIIHASPQVIKEAMNFRAKNKNKNYSMTDCISYLMAKSAGIRFLTGDRGFQNLEDVELVR